MSTSAMPRGRPAGGLVAMAAVLVVVATFSWWTGQVSSDGWLPAIHMAVILLITLPLLHRVAVKDDDQALFWLLTTALVLKLAGAVARHYFAFDVYGGSADAAGYHRWGVTLSENFRSLNFETGLNGWTDTDFIRLLTGGIYTFTGASLLGGFFIYAWLSFLGQLMFHRAFVTAVPGGRRRTYAVMVFFLPTMLFWPSSIGKEAWMVLTLGAAAWGASKILTDPSLGGVVAATVGLAGAAAVRPHIAGLLTVALIGAWLIRRRGDLRVRRVVRIAVVVVLGGVMLLSVAAAQDLLGAENVAGALENTAQRTSGGGSSFDPVLVRTPLDFPLAAVTVLFRPHALEVDSSQALLAAFEGMLLAGLAAWNLPRIARFVRRLRATPYVAMAAAYTLMFIVAYSSIANFGILARQRAQLFPVFAILLALPLGRTPQTEDRTPS